MDRNPPHLAGYVSAVMRPWDRPMSSILPSLASWICRPFTRSLRQRRRAHRCRALSLLPPSRLKSLRLRRHSPLPPQHRPSTIFPPLRRQHSQLPRRRLKSNFRPKSHGRLCQGCTRRRACQSATREAGPVTAFPPSMASGLSRTDSMPRPGGCGYRWHRSLATIDILIHHILGFFGVADVASSTSALNMVARKGHGRGAY